MARKPRRPSETKLIHVSLSPPLPLRWGVPLKSGGHWASPRSHSTVPTELIPFGPRGLSSRRHYREGTRVAPYSGGCCGLPRNQVEINEMALKMGEGDLRGLSPGGARPAGKPRPFLAHPRKSAPPPAPRLWRPPGTRARLGPAALNLQPPSVRPPRLRSSGGRRLLPARSSGRGALRNPSPAVPRRMHRGSGWTRGGSGLPVHGQSSLDHRTTWPTPATPQGRLWAPRPKSSPAPPQPRVGFEPGPHSLLPGRGLESA